MENKVEKISISALIVDDSALMRNLISRMFDDVEDIEVAGTAMNGYFALKKIEKLKPDIIILDLEMPEMDGIEFLKERKKRKIDIPVIILSSLAVKGARITMEALNLGASDFILKPSGSISHNIHETKDELVRMIRAYGGRYMLTKSKQDSHPATQTSATPATQTEPLHIQTRPPERIEESGIGPIEVVAIGISTGGPNALRDMLPSLDKDLPVPILIVQHMPPGFTREFAASLDRICTLAVKEAEEGDKLLPGNIYISPGDRHMEVEQRGTGRFIHLSDEPPVNGHKPSVDVLFRSVAKVYAKRSIAVIMTGMGKDGAREIGRIHAMGGITIAQDESTSIVFGMPKTAIENGFVRYVVKLEDMADTINNLVRANVSRTTG